MIFRIVLVLIIIDILIVSICQLAQYNLIYTTVIPHSFNRFTSIGLLLLKKNTIIVVAKISNLFIDI